METVEETAPLLRPHVLPAQPEPPLNTIQRYAVKFFSCARLLRGLLFIAWPGIILSSFDIESSGGTFLLGSLLGSRDIILGGLLLTADTTQPRLNEVKRALLAALLSDAMDTFILIFSAACAWQWRNPFIEIGAAATLALAEHLTLWSMSEDDEGTGPRAYIQAMQAGEDKKRRLDTWLTELRVAEDAQAGPGSFVAPESIRAGSVMGGSVRYGTPVQIIYGAIPPESQH
ncbi:hypothetical protein N3K66_008966 [Trichothecium roseum]|uniref:Uncharacterized protein n=1 Tax=Trichothecium roseum TaxID=47278 RepID=A0ACC0UPN5_9HYPO|nr:hypothetical protein N3K66_008966 [Trichothecium roseum]